MEEEYHFDPESMVLRRADADDCDAIINLVEIGEDDIYNRVYSYPKILKLIETAYLAITVIDRNTGSVVGFAAFEDFPQVSQHSSSLNAKSRTFPLRPCRPLDCFPFLPSIKDSKAKFEHAEQLGLFRPFTMREIPFNTLRFVGLTWNDR